MALSYIRHLLIHLFNICLRLFAIVMSRPTEKPLLLTQALHIPVPDEIVYEILTWLPVKSLIRFRCVSKSWNSIITNPIFITTHLNRVNSLSNNKNNNNGYLLCTSSCYNSHKELNTFVYNSDGTFSVIANIQFPFRGNITGFCNGMLYYSRISDYNKDARIIYLWNPSIRKFKKLVGPCLHDSYSRFNVGLAYHSQNNDYKILRLLLKYPAYSEEDVKAEIYTLSTDSWRKVIVSVDSLSEYVPKRCIDYIDEKPGLYFNGALHSIACTPKHKFILSFDVNDERFREILLPRNYLDGVSETIECLQVFKGFLAFIVFGHSLAQKDGICHIWVMKEYGVVESWTKKSVPVEGVLRLFGCTVNGELLILTCSGYLQPVETVLFDPESLNKIILRNQDGIKCTTNLMENLVLLNEVNVSSEFELW